MMKEMKMLGVLATVGLAAWCAAAKAPSDPVAYIAHQGEETLAPSHSKVAYRLAVAHGLD